MNGFMFGVTAPLSLATKSDLQLQTMRFRAPCAGLLGLSPLVRCLDPVRPVTAQDALQRKTHQPSMKVDTLRLGSVEAARAGGSGDIWIYFVHPMQFREGRITLATRQPLASRQTP